MSKSDVVPLLERYLGSFGKFSYQKIQDLEMMTIRDADTGRLFIFKCSLNDILDRISMQNPDDLLQDDTRDSARLTLFGIEVWEAMDGAADDMKCIRVAPDGVEAAE